MQPLKKEKALEEFSHVRKGKKTIQCPISAAAALVMLKNSQRSRTTKRQRN